MAVWCRVRTIHPGKNVCTYFVSSASYTSFVTHFLSLHWCLSPSLRVLSIATSAFSHFESTSTSVTALLNRFEVEITYAKSLVRVFIFISGHHQHKKRYRIRAIQHRTNNPFIYHPHSRTTNRQQLPPLHPRAPTRSGRPPISPLRTFHPYLFHKRIQGSLQWRAKNRFATTRQFHQLLSLLRRHVWTVLFLWLLLCTITRYVHSWDLLVYLISVWSFFSSWDFFYFTFRVLYLSFRLRQTMSWISLQEIMWRYVENLFLWLVMSWPW